MSRLHSVDLAVAGVPVRVTSDARAVCDAAALRHPAPALPFVNGCLLEVRTTRAAGTRTAQPVWLDVDADHVTVTAPWLSASLDLAGAVATVELDDARLGEPAVRRILFEGVIYSLLRRKDRHPIHAAAILLDDRALLLSGRSGVGKSTLAYVAARAGMHVLADDASKVQLAPALRVWGDGSPARIHLLESARRDFAELRDAPADWVTPAGIHKITVPLVAHDGWRPSASVARVCLLTRDTAHSSLRRASPDEIERAIMDAPEAVYDREPAQRARVAAALAAPGGWHFALPGSQDALPALTRMFAEMS